jgi:copper transport protein
MRRILLLPVLVLFSVGLLLMPADDAVAHAVLRDSSPKDGTLLDVAPTEVVADFTEPPDLGLSEMTVVGGLGTVESGELQRIPGPGNQVRITLPALGKGVYTVTWRVLSRVDGHVTAGAFSFGVGVEPGAVPAPREGGHHMDEGGRPSALSVAGRWGFYWGLALLLGGAVALLVVFREPLRGTGLLALMAWMLAAAGLVAMFFAELSSVDVSATALLSSERGNILTVRAFALGGVGLGVAYILMRRSHPAAVVLGVTTAVAMAIHSYAGHAAASPSWRWLKVGIQWVHIVAVALWVGGLVWLLLGIWGRESEERAGAVRRFSFLAGFALAGVAATGAARAVNEVGWAPGRLFDTGFGLTVVAKTVLFGGLIALGAYNRYRVIPALASGAKRLGILRRTVSSEITLAAGVFGVTGIMAGLVPPIQSAAGVATPPPSDQVVVAGSDFAETVRVRLAASPGMPGPNSFEVNVQDFDSGEPLPARLVTLRFSIPERSDIGASELELEKVEEGQWRGQGTNLSVGGTWRVGVLIEQAADSQEIALELETGGAHGDEVEVIEGGPGQPDLYTVSLPGERSVQAFVDPGTAGEVHFTFFDPSGGELVIDDARVDGSRAGDAPQKLDVRQLSPGHFVAHAELETGMWVFAVEGTAEDGAVLNAEFELDIEG